MCETASHLKPRKARKPTTKTDQTVQVYSTLNSLTRDQLRALAQHSGVRRGRDKKNTVANLVAAVRAGTVRVKSIVSIALPPPSGQQYGGRVLLTKKFRTYKPDRLIQAVPAPASTS